MLIIQKHLQAVTKELTGKESAPIGELLDTIIQFQKQAERIKELEAGDYTKVLCEVFSCRYCNEGICAHTSIHLKGCTIDADNIVACSEYCES